MNYRCSRCGLVNGVGARSCVGCNGVLGRSSGLNPFENEPKKSFSALRTGVILVAVLFAGFVGYQFVKADPPPKAAAVSQADADKQKQMGDVMMQAQKKEMERHQQMQANFNKMAAEFSKPKFDRELIKNLWSSINRDR